MKIVLGVDTEDIYREAVCLLGRLKFPFSEVVAVNVCEPVPLPAYAVALLAPIDEMEAHKRERSNHLLESVSSEIERITHSVCIGTQGRIGSPSHEMMDAAEQESADLIAIGSHRLGPLESFFTGSVGRALSIHSETSFLVARSGIEDSAEVSAVFATDHSEHSDRCLEELLRLNPLGLTKIHIVFAAETQGDLWAPAERLGFGDLDEDQLGVQLDAIGSKLADKCLQSGRYADYRQVRENPDHALHHRMNATKSQLLILGGKRHGVMERTMFGSVSLHEILNEDFSVLVIRLPEEENMS